MTKTLKDVNEGAIYLNTTGLYDPHDALLGNGKLAGLSSVIMSVPLGYFKAIGEKHGDFGILQIDAHCDRVKRVKDSIISHASVMYNALQ